MLDCFCEESSDNLTPIVTVKVSQYDTWLDSESEYYRQWLKSSCFEAKPANFCVIPNNFGNVDCVVVCIDDNASFWDLGMLPLSLPEGCYQLDSEHLSEMEAGICWGLGAYQFTRYKQASRAPAKLLITKEHADSVDNIVRSICQGRDWVNTPADDMGPSELAEQVVGLAREFGASLTQVIGDELLDQNYPAIHAVGRASNDQPRLLDMRWGEASHPKITLVGKGVCFDTGGLDLKPSRGMLLMKKDMGGAAHVFALARMIMQAKLPISLRVLVPAVENAVSGNAYRPGDVVRTRSGLTVEVGNTDAEGRVVLADALTEAASEQPELIIDIATLTGAARVALGTEIPVMFSSNEKVASQLLDFAKDKQDPAWQLPLYAGYKEMICSNIADLNNCSLEPYGGAITAALFLQAFVPDDIPWVHFDLMAWNLKPKPGRPQGGEMMALRALFAYLHARFAE